MQNFKNTKIDIKHLIKYWKESAKRDFVVAESLFKLKHYSHSLFFCHLSLEKLLKGLVVRDTKTHAPFVHDLVYLIKLTNSNPTLKQIKDLEEINKFNIKARYDNEKLKFYKICNKFYTEKYFEICKIFYLWLEKKYQ
ncbi:MAG: HEPN domain-containing protein [Candidatus Kuenenbacteria bacterium]